jgi:hypothetical protein
MQVPEPYCRSISLLTLESDRWQFDLLAFSADETGWRLSLVEHSVGERSGALFGLLFRQRGNCGWDLSMDIFWMGLIYG